jgi:uncharacterized protein HemX
MKKITAVLVSIAFALGVVGYAAAQTGTTPAPEKKGEMKMEKKPEKKAMSMEEKKAACLEKATTDKAKADCEKKFTAKKPAEKKEMSAKKPEEKK